MVNKVIRNGMVAVLVSPGYGAGWSTWARADSREKIEEMMYDPTIVDLLLSHDPDKEKKIEQIVTLKYSYEYTGGLDGLSVVFVPVGKKFLIEEYDGAESIRLEDDYDWHVA